jgi:hypothetical protein
MRQLFFAVALVASSAAFGQINKDGIMVDTTRTLTYLTGYIEVKEGKENQDDNLVVIIDSDYPELKEGDQIAFMIEGMDFESEYTYKKGEHLDFKEEREAMHLYKRMYPLVIKHGLTYVRINEHKYVFTESERQEIAREARELIN